MGTSIKKIDGKKIVLKEYPGITFKGVKSPRPYYNYRLLAPNVKPGAAAPVLRVESVLFTAKPYGREVLAQLLTLDAGADAHHAAAVCDRLEKEFGGEAYAATEDEGMRRAAAAAAGFTARKRNLASVIKASPGFRKYMYCGAISVLTGAGYTLDDLVCMPTGDLPKLMYHVYTAPVKLCLSPCVPFRCENTEGVKNMVHSNGWKLPEMSRAGFFHVISTFQAMHTREDVAVVEAYDMLKADAEINRNTEMEVSELTASLRRERSLKPAEVDGALAKLLKLGLVVIDGPTVALFENRAFELVIARSLKTICERALEAEDTAGEEWLAVLEGNTAGPICDEQLEAMRMHLTHPLLYVGGNAGSGKTQFLAHVARAHEHEMVAARRNAVWVRGLSQTMVGVTFMCMPAVHLQKRVCGDFAMTCHFLIAAHACSCSKSPYYGTAVGHPPHGLRVKCCLEDLELLIVDELSVMYNELLAVLLSELSLCAKKLKRVVLVGDHRQLASVREGNVLADFMGALPWATKEFRHNHRVSEEAFALIRTNSDAIAEGDFASLRFDGEAVLLREPTGGGPMECEDMLSRVLRELSLPESDLHIVTRTNDLRRSLCRVVERHYLQLEPQDWVFYVGRKFVIKMNDRGLGVANNEILVLEAVWDEQPSGNDTPRLPPPPELGRTGAREGRRFIVRDSTQPWVPEGYERFIAFRGHLYQDNLRVLRLVKKVRQRMVKAAVTTNHAYQGAQTKCIVLVSPPVPRAYDTRECLYTASTRAEQKVVYVTSKAALDAMCHTRERPRTTGLARLLREHIGPFADACRARLAKLKPPGTPNSPGSPPCCSGHFGNILEEDPIENSQ